MGPTHRRLAHRYPEGEWLFVTWSLHGSLLASRYPPPGKQTAGQAFVWMDKYLDNATVGPFFLRHEGIAQIVRDSLLKGQELGHYRLGPYAIMPNHVHVLLLPKVPPPRLLRSLKGATARAANLFLGSTGQPFWQKESYDHRVRGEEEFNRISPYIERNPVNAGLVAKPEDFRWSSASVEMSLDAARMNACATPE